MDTPKGETNLKSLALVGWTSYVLIALGMLLVLAIVGFTSTFVIQYRADLMTKAHEVQTKTHAACSTVAPETKLAFINGQREEARKLGNQHRDNAIKYFSYFYTTWLTLTIFGLIAAIALAVITKTGINSSSPHLIAVFLISTAIVVLYQGSFDTLKQRTNIDLNATASIRYAIVVDQIDTYCTTGKVSMKDPNDVLLAALPKASTGASNTNTNTAAADDADSTKAQPILPFFVEPDGDQFINYIAWQLGHLRNFSISIDDSKIGSIDSKRFLY